MEGARTRTLEEPAAGTRVQAGAETWALAAAMVGVVGSLYLSMGMGLNACPLCFYQRTFMMGVAAVLGVGRGLRLPVPPGTLSLLAFPLAVGGLGVALVHNYLTWNGTLVCPAGVLGLGTAPLQSLIVFAVLTVLLVPGTLTPGISALGSAGRLAFLAGLGALLAGLCVASSPKLGPFKPTFDAAGNRVLKACERAAPEQPGSL